MTGPVSCIFLMGIKHCGKTTIGTLLARQQGYDFVDLDDRILELWQSRYGSDVHSVREVYRAVGQDGFRAIETEAAATLLSRSNRSGPGAAAPVAGTRVPRCGSFGTRLVIALGGGTIENSGAMSHLEGRGLFLYLLQDEDTLFRRIMAGGLPPFLKTQDPRATFGELFHRRDALYRMHADRVVDIRNLKTAEAVSAVVDSIER